MTKTVTFVDKRRIYGQDAVRYADLDITSYTASGESVTAADVGLKRLEYIEVVDPDSDNGHIWRWDNTNSKVRAYKLNAAGGITTEIFSDVLGGKNADTTGDSGSALLNDAVVMALAAADTTASGDIAHSAGKSTGLTNPNTLDDGAYAGRNVVVSQKAAGGGTTFTTANVIVTGTDQFGTAFSETIAIQTGAVAASNWRSTVGTKVFATVTNVRLTAAQPAGSTISVGVGTIFGLRGKITAESDIKNVQKDAAQIAAATYVGSSTLHSIDMGADVADAVDLYFEYDAVASSLVDREAASGIDVGQCRIKAVGR